MGGSASIIATVFSSVLGAVSGRSSDKSDGLERERRARKEEQLQKEADERRRDREKVQEARQLEKKRNSGSALSRGAASLKDTPEVTETALKQKLGE